MVDPNYNDCDFEDEDSEDQSSSDSEEDEESDGDEYTEAPRQSNTTASQGRIQLTASSQRDLYLYDPAMTDQQRHAQDERNFAGIQRTTENSSKAAEKRKIRFNSKGELEYTENATAKRPKWQRAVFHYWVRNELTQKANAGGTCQFACNAGRGRVDTTAFLDHQRTWGTDRPNYAPIMFEYEPPNRRVPITLSAGGFITVGLSSITSVNLCVTSETSQLLCLRRSPIIVNRSGDLVLVPQQNAFTGRRLCFRFRAGAIPWVPRQGNAELKAYIDQIHAQQRPGRVGNDTRGCQDLTEEQIAGLKLVNEGEFGERAKMFATAKGKATHQRDIERKREKAGKGPKKDKIKTRKTVKGADDIDETSEVPTTSRPDQSASTAAAGADIEAGEESDDSDILLYDVPSNQAERDHITTLLLPTLRHYRHITGFDPQTNEDECYIEQWNSIQAGLQRWWTFNRREGNPPDLVQLVEYNDRRAVWNMVWQYAVFMMPPDLTGRVEEHMDGAGRNFG